MTLILGGSGQVGTAFRNLLPDAYAPSHADFDLADVAGIAAGVRALRPDRIINCAAYTAVDAAEDDEATANLINGDAVAELAAVADALGIPFVTFSTDYVFDGDTDEPYTETSQPNPINAYGRSKLMGERAALRVPGSLVVRTSWLFSATHPNFVATILAKAAEGEIRVVDDQWGRPTPVPALATTTLRALEDGAAGLLHLACPPTTTWFELARAACEAAGIDPRRVTPCSSDEYRRPARRPRHAVLGATSCYEMPDWRAELAGIVAELRNDVSAVTNH
ncbi:MAG: dTDP-4-dehydrorhamnose reductase, partial [Acidimicrobiia bacterium]